MYQFICQTFTGGTCVYQDRSSTCTMQNDYST